MAINDDTKEPIISDGDIEGTLSTGKPIETDSGELERPVRVGGDLAGVIRQAAAGPTEVTLNRTRTVPTEDQALWAAIRNRTRAIGFDRYYRFIDRVLCQGEDADDSPEGLDQPSEIRNGILKRTIRRDRRDLNTRNTLHGIDSYNLLKLATEAFLIFECGLVDEQGQILDPQLLDENAESRRFGRPVTIDDISDELTNYLAATPNGPVLPYLNRIVTQIVGIDPDAQAQKLPYCEAILRNRLTCPSLLELIWSYWQEQGALAQTINVLALRFQNKRWRDHDPLANLELDPLRPLNHILWGFIQDEYSRLSLQRRAYEYDHQYGLILLGRAVPRLQSADSRSRFLQAFHNLLHRTALFYREDDDTTVIADAFSLLNALREVHLILAEGAHNQYGDLPWTARREMLIMQWLLARPETKEFLRGRYMVPYQEPWMGAVDDMKRLQGWDEVTVTHYHELAVCGEQILLSVRFGDWIAVNDQQLARNWARYFRPEIQRYIHAYHAATGVDLSADITDVRLAESCYIQPAILLDQRQARQLHSPRILPGRSQGRRLPAPAAASRSLEIDYARHSLLSRRRD
jgi:hypothetical protein